MRSLACLMVALVLGAAYALGVSFARALVVWWDSVNPIVGG